MTKAINVRPRARGRVGGVWSALWVIKRKQRELIALAANLILLIYAFNCALCILHCALSNDDFRGFGALTAEGDTDFIDSLVVNLLHMETIVYNMGVVENLRSY